MEERKVDNDQQRDTTDERSALADLEREGREELEADQLAGYALLVDVEKGDARAPEWHQERASEAISEGLLDLAHAHLYLAAELDRAIGIRAQRHRNATKAAQILQSLPLEASRRLWAALEERTVQVPHLGVTREERPSGPPGRTHWHGVRPPARHLEPVETTHERDGFRAFEPGPPEPTAPRGCTTCGGLCGYFDTPNHVGWWHLGGDGEPIRVADSHHPTLEA